MNMDYKYIEQLLERYWECSTSLDEESKLRDFFLNEEVPVHLRAYKELFVYQRTQQKITLSDDFDKRILAQIEPSVVKAKRISFTTRLLPLYKAVAMVAVVLLLGNVLQRSLFAEEALDYNYEAYTDTYDDPEVAYKQISSALMMLSEGIHKSQGDSASFNVIELLSE